MDMNNESKTKMTGNEALKLLRDSWNKGIELSQENTAARLMQRLVIANRVKQLRTEREISQEKFSELVGVAFLTYKGYENRKSDIPIHTLVRIANELDTTLDYLAGRTDNRKTEESIEGRLKKLEEAILRKNDTD